MSRIQDFIAASNRSGEVTEKLIRSFYAGLPQRRTFIDGGANLGYHTNHARRNFTGPVIAVEASPQIFSELISAQVALTNNTPLAPVIPVSAALGYKKRQGTTVQFHHSHTHPGRSTINRDLWDDWSKKQVGYDSPTEVAIVEIDDLVSLFSKGQPVDFIKLDLEGNEINALRSAEQTLKNDRPPFVMEFGMKPAYEHLYQETCEGFLTMMASQSYALYTPWAERAEASIMTGYPFNYLFAFPVSNRLDLLEGMLKDVYQRAEF